MTDSWLCPESHAFQRVLSTLFHSLPTSWWSFSHSLKFSPQPHGHFHQETKLLPDREVHKTRMPVVISSPAPAKGRPLAVNSPETCTVQICASSKWQMAGGHRPLDPTELICKCQGIVDLNRSFFLPPSLLFSLFFSLPYSLSLPLPLHTLHPIWNPWKPQSEQITRRRLSWADTAGQDQWPKLGH